MGTDVLTVIALFICLISGLSSSFVAFYAITVLKEARSADNAQNYEQMPVIQAFYETADGEKVPAKEWDIEY